MSDVYSLGYNRIDMTDTMLIVSISNIGVLITHCVFNSKFPRFLSTLFAVSH
jgi:hypothetical protein